MRRLLALRDLADDVTHAALTPLLGREFDPFLFATLGDEQDGPLLSVVSALARLDVDPWKEAAILARMPRDKASNDSLGSLRHCRRARRPAWDPEIIAGRMIALLPQAGSDYAAAPATLRPVAAIPRSRLFVGLGVLALLLVGC